MVEYLYSTKNYKKLLLTDSNTSIDFITQYISGINHSGLTRYLVSDNRIYTQKSQLYKILEGKEIDIDIATKYGSLEIVKYIYSEGYEATENTITNAVSYGHVEIVKYLNEKDATGTMNVGDLMHIINTAATYGRSEILTYASNIVSKIISTLNFTFRYSINVSSKNGYLKNVKYLHNKGLTNTKYGIPIEIGHLEMAKYLYSLGVRAGHDADFAAHNGNLKLAEYLNSQDIVV